MGTTKTALQAGSITRKWVAAIEGYSHLLSDATEAQVQAAWTGTDWASTTIIGELTVELDIEQRLDPRAPFHGGGSLSLIVKDVIADTAGGSSFGIDVHRKTAGDETYLAASLDSDDDVVTVLDTSTFASSGDVHIGTECIQYTATTATEFTSDPARRGRFSPFGVDGGTRFGRPHRVRNDPNQVTIAPLVTEQPREWIGRMVGLWMHRVSGGTLDLKAQAQLVFAGRIVGYRDDPETMSTIVECEHILDSIAEATLVREQYTAETQGGIYLASGITFSLKDNDDVTATAFDDATDLQVVPSGATPPYEINKGVYTAEELHSALNAWFSQAKQDGDINGFYSISVVKPGTADAKTQILWTIDQPGGSPTTAAWTLTIPNYVAPFLGFQNQGTTVGVGASLRRAVGALDQSSDTEVRTFLSNDVPLRSILKEDFAGNFVPTLLLSNERGVFSNQYSSLPASGGIKPVSSGGLEWGLFLVENRSVIVAAKDGDELTQIKPIHNWEPFQSLNAKGVDLTRGFDEQDSGFEIRQIFAFESTLATWLKRLFYSTGTSGYNHADYDVLPFGCGLGIPGVLLGDTFEASIDSLPGALLPEVVILDKPRPLAEFMTGNLMARWAFPRWKDQGLQFCLWSTPVSGAAVATLGEGTKAAPSGQGDNHRTSSFLMEEWRFSVVKWEYDRDFSAIGDERYRSDYYFEDPTAIDDAGGDARPLTIQFPNLFGDEVQVGTGLSQLALLFLGNFSLFSGGAYISTRSIDARYWEGYSVGDIVTIQDEFARDPDTGLRGVSRTGIIVSHRWQPGGGDVLKPGEMSGEVDVMFLEVNRAAAYVPCAQLDDTSTNAGYVVATKVITCYAHAHSESSESADASYFPAGAKIRVIEIDNASGLSWDDTVASQTGNTITVTTGLGGFDNTKRYRVISDDYGDATSTQRTAYTYQADDADGLVANTRGPYRYIFSLFDTTTPTANSTSDILELPPAASYGDGVGRDVGFEAGINRLCTNLNDFKTAISAPKLDNTTMSGSGVSGTYKLVEIRPVFLGADVLTTTITRNVSVSTWFRSSDGASATVRISLVRQYPGDNSTNDVDRGQLYSEQTFTTTSTTWAAATAANLTATIKGIDGLAYLLVECTVKAETRGIVECQVSERQYA